MMIGQFIYAQNSDSPKSNFKNDFGIDVTQFFTVFNSNFTSNSPYFITYRRNYEKGALRFGLGGRSNSSNSNVNPQLTDFDVASHQLDFRAGYEWQSNFAKRWQVYYGVDAGYGLLHNVSTLISSTGDESWRQKEHTDVYSLSPMLGFKFKLNNRLTLASEASYKLSHVYYSANAQQEQTGNDVNAPKRRSWNANFVAPNAVYLICFF